MNSPTPTPTPNTFITYVSMHSTCKEVTHPPNARITLDPVFFARLLMLRTVAAKLDVKSIEFFDHGHCDYGLILPMVGDGEDGPDNPSMDGRGFIPMDEITEEDQDFAGEWFDTRQSLEHLVCNVTEDYFYFQYFIKYTNMEVYTRHVYFKSFEENPERLFENDVFAVPTQP